MLCRAFRPEVIHCSSPGIMWLAALLYSRLLKKPLVYSYHTHVPEYMPRCVRRVHAWAWEGVRANVGVGGGGCGRAGC